MFFTYLRTFAKKIFGREGVSLVFKHAEKKTQNDHRVHWAYVRLLTGFVILAFFAEFSPKTATGQLLFPSTSGVVSFYIEDFSFLVSSVIASGYRVWTGIIVGSVIGFSFGTLVTMSRKFEVEQGVLLRFGLAFPRFVILGFFLLWCGYTDTTVTLTVIYSAVLITAFQSMYAVLEALDGGKNKDPELKGALQTYFNSNIDLLVKYVWPETRPQRFTALQYCSVILWPSLILVEGITRPNTPGLGAFIWNIRGSGLDPNAMFGVALIFVVCAGVSSRLITFLQHHTKWF